MPTEKFESDLGLFFGRRTHSEPAIADETWARLQLDREHPESRALPLIKLSRYPIPHLVLGRVAVDIDEPE